MKQCITPEFVRCRDILRIYWNLYLLELHERIGLELSHDAVCNFNQIHALAIEELRAVAAVSADLPAKDIAIVLEITRKEDGDVLLERKSDDMNHYWDGDASLITQGATDLEFVEFFDWRDSGYREIEFCRARVLQCELDSLLVGYHVLVLHHFSFAFAHRVV